MSLCTDIETAIATKAQADAWIGDPDHVKTLEIGVREALFPGWNISEAYHPGELPALSIIALVNKKQSQEIATNELQHAVPVKLIGIVQATGDTRTRSAAARSAALVLADNLERLLNACRKSETSLAISGRGNFVRDVSAVVEVFGEAAVHYGVAEVDAIVDVVRDMEE